MTLIACTISGKAPFMTSDILMSSREGDPDFRVPTIPYKTSMYLSERALYKPHSLAQKLYIIKSNACICVAGSEYELTPFIKELKTRCSYYDSLTGGHIGAFLAEYRIEEQLKASAFFITCIESSGLNIGIVRMFRYPQPNPSDPSGGVWRESSTPTFDSVIASGSGAESFISFVEQSGRFQSKYEKGDPRYAYQANVSMIAQMLAMERRTSHNLLSHWGAGFETAYFNGEEFVKVSNLAYVICHGSFDEFGDIGLPKPSLFLYYTYRESTLLIFCLEVSSVSHALEGDNILITVENKNLRSEVYVVPPLDGNQSKTNTTVVDFETETVALGYGITTPQNGVFLPTLFNVGPEIKIQYVHGQGLKMRMASQIGGEIRRQARSVFAQNWK